MAREKQNENPGPQPRSVEGTDPRPLADHPEAGHPAGLEAPGAQQQSTLQAPLAPTLDESLGSVAEDAGTRRVRATANVAGLKAGEEGDLPENGDLAGLLASGLVVDVAEEKREKAAERKAEGGRSDK